MLKTITILLSSNLPDAEIRERAETAFDNISEEEAEAVEVVSVKIEPVLK
jgi:hypothetical protein